MKDYIKIARPDHWIKNLFIFPGTLFALLLVGWKGSYGGLAGIALVSFFCTCMIASANYVINEWLDAQVRQVPSHQEKTPRGAEHHERKNRCRGICGAGRGWAGASLLVNIRSLYASCGCW